MNAAAHVNTDFALQCNAAWMAATGALHDGAMLVQFFGKFSRYGAAQGRIALAPVKTGAKKSAAGAAGDTGVVQTIRHRVSVA